MTLFEQFYDADYVASRDALIPKAVIKANRNFGAACKEKSNEKALERYARGWSKCFHQEMNRLWRAQL